ncbi:MAG: beta-ketoacyl synthase [Chitinophagales bacterium]|nr:beta-ketoacyl synthase [Chitinophagaceae bacterium]MCB9064864.1 beta-ketoacyl synthase [Chitinophagales bacterium]
MAEVTTHKNVYAIASNITSAMGLDTIAHWKGVSEKKSPIKEHDGLTESKESYWASKLNEEQWKEIKEGVSTQQDLPLFETLCLYSIQEALAVLNEPIDTANTILILSTTKGNIEWLNQVEDCGIALHKSASILAKEVGITNKPIVVSHACVSGAVALHYAQRLIQSGRCENAIVVGCDKFTGFVLNGFQSFQAIASGPCRPFDKDRTGINLGEAAATIILSSTSRSDDDVQLLSGATSNDANHISGPSRTGAELSYAIDRAMSLAGLQASDIGMISAHGTATPYNDEMEAKAINLSGLNNVPVHSMKSYTGHTLGAAGVLESVMIVEAIKHNQLIPSLGYKQHGVPVPLNVTTELQNASLHYVLKTASGFGGCNAALVWGRP